MAEYRIVTKIDPAGVTAGANVVEQELRGIDTAAASTKQAINRAFDASSFDRSIGSLIGRFESLEQAITSLDRTSASVATTNQTVATSLNAVAEAGVRAGGAVGDVGTKARSTASGQAALDAATRRVLEAVDDEAAQMLKLNKLLADAEVLLQKGVITQDQYARVQKLVTQGTKEHVVSAGQQRQGVLQLGEQFRQFATEVQLGISPVTAFAQQSGQAAFALTNFGGAAGKVGNFMAGVYGTLILVAASAMIGFVAELLKGNAGLDDALDKLKKDTQETEVGREAKRVFGLTLEGVTEALIKNKEALKGLTEQHKTQAEQDLVNAVAAKLRLDSIANETRALITQAHALYEVAKARAAGPGQRGELAALNLPEAFGSLDALQSRLGDIDRQAAEAGRQIDEARSHVEVEIGDRDGSEQIKKRYDRLIEATRARLVAEHAVTGEIAAQTRALADQRDAEVKAYEKSQREHREKSDGVPRFRSREQAVGIAGRELQQQGLRVGENEQFGGVHAHHTFAQHGKFAIDVNFGKNITEADDPELKDRFDELARAYQARGFRVLWNGRIYEAGGDGPGPLIPAHNRKGQAISQHRDHLHIEAPAGLVGKPTESSFAAAATAEFRRQQQAEKAAARLAEQKKDFVQGIEDEAAARGQEGKVDTVKAQIERRKAQYLRKFNVAMSPEEEGKVTKALTDADAREIANRFDLAYTKPLERLQALQGKTGIEREVLNAQLTESTRIGRELTPVEKGLIENSIRGSAALQREAEILAGMRQPVEDYRNQIEALSKALAKGEIDQVQFNAAVANLDLHKQANSLIGGLSGRNAAGSSFADISARREADDKRDTELAQLANFEKAKLNIGVTYAQAREAIEREHSNRLRAIDDARKEAMLGSAMSISDSLVSIAENSVGKQSAIYKGLFIISKAFAIADAIIKIQQGIANALSLPFPANLAAAAAVAAAAASIVANIQAVKLNLASGGYVSGPGGPRDDKVPANLSNGEFVVNADSTSRHRALLEAINNGRIVTGTRRAANDNIGLARAAGGDSYHFSFGNVVVPISGSATRDDARMVGREVKEAISSIVDEKLRDAGRDGGRLTRTRQSVMTG